MTLRELSRYYKLHERLERNRQMLISLSEAAGPGARALTGMPRAPGVSDKVGNLAVELTDLEERIACLEVECDLEKKKIQAYISKIRDDQTRMVFRLRFLRCMTWAQVASSIGGGNTEQGVKKICYRYLDAEKEEARRGAK